MMNDYKHNLDHTILIFSSNVQISFDIRGVKEVSIKLENRFLHFNEYGIIRKPVCPYPASGMAWYLADLGMTLAT